MVENPNIQFVHRSLSILVVLINFYLFVQTKKIGISYVYLVDHCDNRAGSFDRYTMYYVDFPFGSQPIHLLLQVFYLTTILAIFSSF